MAGAASRVRRTPEPPGPPGFTRRGCFCFCFPVSGWVVVEEEEFWAGRRSRAMWTLGTGFSRVEELSGRE
jgi:hypothetical protein